MKQNYILNLKIKYQPQYEEFRVYKRRIGVRYKISWQSNWPICNPKSLQKQFLPLESLKGATCKSVGIVIERLKGHRSAHPRKATG